MYGLNMILGWNTCAFLLCSGLLWARRQEGDRSRLYLSFVWLVSGLGLLLRLFLSETGRPSVGYVLPVENLCGGLLVIMALYLYPMEAICRGWLTQKRIALFFLPGLLLSVMLLVLSPYSRALYSFADIWAHIGEFNVWFRLVILFAGILFYTILLFFIPYNWMKSRVYYRWIVYYSLKIQLIGVLFILFMLTGSAFVSAVHLVVCMVVAVTVTYEELFIRFEMPRDSSVFAEAAVPDVLPSSSEAGEGNPIVVRIRNLMDEEQIWRNPDLTFSDLTSRLNTNRSYVSKAIQECGYKNFSDMMNRRRIADFLKEADAGQVASVQDAFFRVGFRSRETALRCFKKYVGLSPTDYIRSRMMPAETSSD